MTELDDKNFVEFVANGVVVVDFWAEWCAPCKRLTPVLEGLAAKTPQVSFGKINIDDFPNLASQYKVTSIPTMIFLKNGVEYDRLVGLVPASKIEGKIDVF